MESGTRQSSAESAQRLAAAELQSALAEKAKIEAEYAATYSDLHAMQVQVLSLSQHFL